MKTQSKKLWIVVLIITQLLACQKELDTIQFDGTFIESGSAIVVNEGSFGNNNASASFISRNGVVSNNIYSTINGGAVLGDVFQSYFVVGTKGICILNNSKKIEIVDARSFRNIGTIIDASKITYPRYAIAQDTTKVYISNGSGAGTLVVLNPTTKTIVKTINVGNGPEQMLIANNSIYVANSGGYGVDSTVSVVSLTTEIETQKIIVGDIPSKMVKDANGNIWVLCLGQSDYSNWPNVAKLTPSKLVKINTSNNTVERTFTLVASGSVSYTGNLTIGNNGQTLYYSIDQNVYTLPITASTLSPTLFLSGRTFYGLSAHPNNGQLYACYAPSFSTDGYVFRYNANGLLIDSLKVGIGPNSIIFNN